jgi:hypothetical protein
VRFHDKSHLLVDAAAGDSFPFPELIGSGFRLHFMNEECLSLLRVHNLYDTLKINVEFSTVLMMGSVYSLDIRPQYK